MRAGGVETAPAYLRADLYVHENDSPEPADKATGRQIWPGPAGFGKGVRSDAEILRAESRLKPV